jgi:uncharacterized protein (TIRG00374 family)
MKTFLKFFVSIALLAAVTWWVGPRKLWTAFSHAELGPLVFVFFLQLLFFILGMFKVLSLTTALAPKISRPLVMRSCLRATAIGNFAPSKIGELTFPHFISKAGVSHGLGLAVLLVDKLITFVVVSFVGCAGIVIFLGPTHAVYVGAVAVAGLLGALLLVASERARAFVRAKILRSHEKKFKGFFSDFKTLLLKRRHALVSAFSLSFLRMFVQGCLAIYGFEAFGIEISMPAAIAIMAIIQLSSWIPITLSGLGLSQGAAVFLFATFQGADEALTLDLFLLLTVFVYFFSALFLAVFGYRSDRLATASAKAHTR